MFPQTIVRGIHEEKGHEAAVGGVTRGLGYEEN